MTTASMYCNEILPFPAEHLANRFPQAVIDQRSIVDVKGLDVANFTRCLFFAGIGGWELALHLASWPSDRPVWTGSCPCQPFSDAAAPRHTSFEDRRHLWPEFRRLIAECRPTTIFGEQVASKLGREWLSRLRADLEVLGYRVGAADLCAASVGAPHIRQRLFWVADSSGKRCKGIEREIADSQRQSQVRLSEKQSPWHGASHPFEQWKKLLAQPNVMRMADGVSSTVDIRPRLHAYGNTIVPQLAAVFIRSFMETE